MHCTVCSFSFSKDHFLLALKDMFSSYTPPVPSHLCKVHFVPVVEAEGDDPPLDPSASLPADWACHSEICRDLPHELRESRYCWCDCEAISAMERGMLNQFYVVELCIPPWDPQDQRNKGMVIEEAPQIPPVFQVNFTLSAVLKNDISRKQSYSTERRRPLLPAE